MEWARKPTGFRRRQKTRALGWRRQYRGGTTLAFRFRRFHARQENNRAGREGGEREQIKGVDIADHAGLPADLAGQPGERGGAVHRPDGVDRLLEIEGQGVGRRAFGDLGVAVCGRRLVHRGGYRDEWALSRIHI
mgnify:CR=1 FL=1